MKVCSINFINVPKFKKNDVHNKFRAVDIPHSLSYRRSVSLAVIRLAPNKTGCVSPCVDFFLLAHPSSCVVVLGSRSFSLPQAYLSLSQDQAKTIFLRSCLFATARPVTTGVGATGPRELQSSLC